MLKLVAVWFSVRELWYAVFPQLMLLWLGAFVSRRAQSVQGSAETSVVKRKVYLEVGVRWEGAWKLPAPRTLAQPSLCLGLSEAERIVWWGPGACFPRGRTHGSLGSAQPGCRWRDALRCLCSFSQSQRLPTCQQAQSKCLEPTFTNNTLSKQNRPVPTAKEFICRGHISTCESKHANHKGK